MEAQRVPVTPEQSTAMTDLQLGWQPLSTVPPINSSGVLVTTAHNYFHHSHRGGTVSSETALRNPTVDSSANISHSPLSTSTRFTQQWHLHAQWTSSPGTPSSTPHSTQPQDPVRTMFPEAQSTTLFKHVPQEDLPTNPCMYWRLSKEERCLLAQLTNTYQDTVLAVLQTSPPSSFIDDSKITPDLVLHAYEKDARQAVTFAKRLQNFRTLPTDEQIALMKSSFSQVLDIQSCALYVEEKDAWLKEYGYFTVDQCQLMFPNHHPLLDQCVKVCRTIKSIAKNDITLYALLHCILLFDPCDKRVMDRQLVNTIRDKYIILLRHYLQSVYSYDHSERYMMVLQENLVLCRVLCEEDKNIFKQLYPVIDNKLLAELLDID